MLLLSLYTGAFLLGGILVAASALGAGKDADHDVGSHAEPGGELAKDLAHVGAGANGVAAIVLSLRFWTFLLAAFGATGLLTEWLAPSLPSLLLALPNGIAIGAFAAWAVRRVANDTVSSALDARQMAGREAEVVLSVGPDKLGKVRLTHQGQLLELPATTAEQRRIERGERVLIVSVMNGTADVTPTRPEHREPLAVRTPPLPSSN
jgi:membrane protein implicated in regulation of membrane protease activity